METIKHAYIPSPFAGDRYMQQIADKILQKKELHPYLYPDYLLTNGRANFEIAEQIIKYHELLPLVVHSFETKNTNAVKFFVFSQIFERKKRNILRYSIPICRPRFQHEYIFNKKMEMEFERITEKGMKFLEVIEDQQVQYVLVINQSNELIMVVSI
ncbi:MAG: hypothetical protein R2799_05675 [Crocinitomicaceae bacterium]